MKATDSWRLTFAATALICMWAPGALAQAQVSDAQCLVVSNLFLRAGDDKEKTTAMQASFFYLGRMSGSAAEVEAKLAAEAKKVTQANNGATMTACAQAMMARVKELSAIDVKLGPPTQK